MREWLQVLVGDFTAGELTLVVIVFGTIVAFSWAPRLGAALGGWMDGGSD